MALNSDLYTCDHAARWGEGYSSEDFYSARQLASEGHMILLVT